MSYNFRLVRDIEFLRSSSYLEAVFVLIAFIIAIGTRLMIVLADWSKNRAFRIPSTAQDHNSFPVTRIWTSTWLATSPLDCNIWLSFYIRKLGIRICQGRWSCCPTAWVLPFKEMGLEQHCSTGTWQRGQCFIEILKALNLLIISCTEGGVQSPKDN